MLSDVPTIGIRFDVDKVDSGSYGIACWKIFWTAIGPAQLPGAMLFEGDTTATMEDRENVFCIAIQCLDDSIIEQVKLALIESDAFRAVCARPRFVEGDQCAAEPLPLVDQIDCAGTLTAEASNPAYALQSLR